MKIAIITSGILPVPASRGGAVEAIVQNLVESNETFRQFELVIISIYDKAAAETAKRYACTDCLFIKTPAFIKGIDRCVYFIAKHMLRVRKNISYRYIWQRLYFIRKAAALLHENEYDKVILENNPTLFRTLKRRGNDRKYRERYYLHLHNEITNHFWYRNLMMHCAKILSVSDFVSRSVQSSLEGIDPVRLRVLKNAVCLDAFQKPFSDGERLALRQKYHILPDDRVVLFTGRLSPEKGVRELLAAFERLPQQNYRLLIAGSYFFESDACSPYQTELQSRAAHMKGRVVFTGFVPYGQMPLLYSIADAAVLPSIWNEPAGMTVLEAMAAGLPVITTRSGGIPEYAGFRNAILLERDENLPENIAAALERLFHNDLLRKTMGQASREAARSFGLADYYRNFQKIMQEGEADETVTYPLRSAENGR